MILGLSMVSYPISTTVLTITDMRFVCTYIDLVSSRQFNLLIRLSLHTIPYPAFYSR
jgi:hypothetical protein